MSTIIVTGGAGFIGSHVADLVLERGDRAVVFDDLSTGRLDNLHAHARFLRGDITSAEDLATLRSEEPHVDGIIHCAAQASVISSTTDPAHDLSVNVLGTINVLELAAEYGCPLTFTSTGGALYGNGAPLPTPESCPPRPGSPYGASKASAEVYVRLWSDQQAVGHSICRLGNVYGPRQRGDGEAGVIAIFTERILKNQSIVLYGHGEATRDYVHVRDVAKAILASLAQPGTYNIASGTSTSVERILELVRLAIPGVPTVNLVLADLRPGELSASCLDVTRARKDLDWQSTTELETGIRETVETIISRTTSGDSSNINA